MAAVRDVPSTEQRDQKQERNKLETNKHCPVVILYIFGVTPGNMTSGRGGTQSVSSTCEIIL